MRSAAARLPGLALTFRRGPTVLQLEYEFRALTAGASALGSAATEF
jgi:hypothetical protein